MYRKNTAGQFICVQLLLTATGAVATGLSPAARRCIDGTFAAGGGTFTEDGTTGSYKYALAQADTNGNDISIIVTATGAIPVCVNFVTTAADPTNAATFGITDIDATISSRMATYTQPTGFLAATFPSGTVANQTNITGGTITTVGTLTTYTGNTPQTGDNFPRLGAPAGLSIAADLAEIEGETDTLITGVNVTQWAGQNALLDANNLPKVDVEAINASTLAAQALAQMDLSVCWGTCSGGTTTTAVVSALSNPASLTDAGQLIGRTIIFLGNSGTANMQAQASNITASTTGATPTLTFTAMTHAPANGDKFVIV